MRQSWHGKPPTRGIPQVRVPAYAALWFALSAATALAAAPGTAQPALQETPSLAAEVASGALPPVAERLPRVPSLVRLADDREPGKPGGELKTLIGNGRDVRFMVVYGYARLVAYDRQFVLRPDILQDFKVEDGRRFTFKLRPGHKWSDGAPFTAEDFRYYWDDIANNPELSPSGPPRALLVDGEPPRFEVIDATTVRYTWKHPNPTFLASLAGPTDIFIYRPAHYLKQFHKRYAKPAELKAALAQYRQRSWAALHNYLDNMYRFDNPDEPTLQPWHNITRAPAIRFIGERNAYFHRVDQNGRQLPYIDRLVMIEAAPSLIAAKTAAGEADLQVRYLAFSDYTFLRAPEARQAYHTYLWRAGAAAHFALYPNLNVSDAGMRSLFRDVRFRRALSLSIDREAINQSLFFGLAKAGNNTVLDQSPLYREHLAKAWARHDPALANRLLDEIGVTRRNSEGIRLLADGRPLQIVVETAGEDTEQTDILQLVRDDWRQIGVKLFTKPSQRQVFRNRVFSGLTAMSVWSGWDNGIPTADMTPAELAPTMQGGLQWPKWGQYFETGNTAGEPPDLPEAVELLRLYKDWRATIQTAERERIWARMLDIHAEQQFIIGVVAAVPQPIVVRDSLHNVPHKGIYNWDPGAQLGIYRPDTFWFD